MKNVLKVNHVDRTIVMDRTFAKYAENTMSDEYAHLQRVRKDYPNYSVIQRQIKRNSNKKTYNGLTYEYMEDYIMTHGSAKEINANLKEFYEKRLIAECHGKAFRYPAIKRWFLEKYPAIATFHAAQYDLIEDARKKRTEAREQMKKQKQQEQIMLELKK